MRHGSPRPMLSGFRAALAAALTRAAGREPDRAAAVELDRFAALARALEGAPESPTAPPGARVPVCRFWKPALDRAATGPAAGLVPGLRALGPRLRWTQNPNYRRRPPDRAFLEAYLVLSGDAEWWRGAGPWRREPTGAVIYHASAEPHAMRAGVRPLLALYLWRGDLATHARLAAPARRRRLRPLTPGRAGR